MADNLAYTPGSGATVASDEVGGVHYQRVKVVTGSDGVVDGDVGASNPLPVMGSGELVESLEAIRTALNVLVRNTGNAYPDVSGRMRVAVDAISATLANVTTVATVSNQTNVGGYSAAPQVQALTMIGAETLRRNISVT